MILSQLKNKPISLILLILLIVGFLIRFYKLDSYPPSLNWDEISHGYNAYSISKTLKDEWGFFMPDIFRAYGDYKLPVYIYVLAPLIYIFDLSESIVRLPSVIIGCLNILGIYFLTKALFNKHKHNKKIAILASSLITLNPWNFFLSRIAVEAYFASGLFIWGCYFLLNGLYQFKNTNKYASGLVIGSIFLGLTMFTYNSYRIFTPLFYLSFVILNRETWKFRIPFLNKFNSEQYKSSRTCKCHIVSFSIFTIFLGFSLLQLFSPSGFARASNISILDAGAINNINSLRLNSSLDPFVQKLFYNKMTYSLPIIISNYFSYFDPRFWFVNGSSHYQFGIPNAGLLWNFELFFVVIGIIYIIKHLRNYKTIIIWIMLAPIATSLTRDNPHALRIITLNPIPIILSALGIFLVYNRIINSKFYISVLSLILISILSLNIYQYINNYFNTYPVNYSFAWQYGNKQLSQQLLNYYPNYDYLFVTKKLGEPHAFLAFYQKWDPTNFQLNKTWEYRDANTSQAWYWINKYDKYIFYNDWELSQVSCPNEAKCLLVSSIPDDKWKSIITINDFKGQSIYYISDNL